MADDPNNPQRAAVIEMERRHIEGVTFVRLRLEASLAGAAAIAMTPGAGVNLPEFMNLARDTYNKIFDDFQLRVEEEVTRREFALASPTNKKEDQS